MSLLRVRVLLGCVLVLSQFACRTTKKPDGGSAFVDGDEAVRLDPNAPHDKSVPSFLWSPGRRRATASYLYLASENMGLTGQNGKAASALEAAYNLDPNAFLGAKMIAAQANQGDSEKALLEAKRMVLLYPKSADLRFLLGQLLRSKDYEGAVREFERAVALEPLYEAAYLNLIVLHQLQKKNDAATKVAERYVKALPNSALAWSMLARQLILSDKKKQALEPAQRAYELQSSNPEFVLIYALTLEMNDQSKKAISLYEQLYRLYPTNEELIARMIDLYRQVGGLDEAMELLGELDKLPGGKRPGVQLQRAILLWETQKFAEAAAILDRLAQDFPESDRFIYMSALGKEKLQKFDEAIAQFKSIPETSQFRPQADVRSILILREQKRYDAAIEIVEEMIAREDVVEEAFVVGATIYDDVQKPKRSLEVINQGIEKYPDKARLIFLRGAYEEKLGMRDECIATMRQVIKMEPRNSSALNFLGYVFAEAGENLAEAEALILKALEIKPDDGFYLDSLGWVYFQKKDYERALDTLQKAAKLAPDEGVIYEHLADTYLALRRIEDARQHYEKALATKLETRDEKRISEKFKLFQKKHGEGAER